MAKYHMTTGSLLPAGGTRRRIRRKKQNLRVGIKTVQYYCKGRGKKYYY